MDTSRSDFIRQALELFDTCDNLRYDNRILREKVAAYTNAVPAEVEHIGWMDEKVLAYGRKQLVDKVMPYWREVKIALDEDEEAIVNVESYEDWLARVVEKHRLPDWCSLDDFCDYFSAELKEIYDNQREIAIAKVHNGDD